MGKGFCLPKLDKGPKYFGLSCPEIARSGCILIHILVSLCYNNGSRFHEPVIIKLLGIKWYHHVRNDEVRRTTGQPRLSAIVQGRRLSLFGHIARMPDETDARSIIPVSPSENWRKPPGRPQTTWMKTIQQDLRSNNLSLDVMRR